MTFDTCNRPSYLDDLCRQLSLDLPHLRRAQEHAGEMRAQIRDALKDIDFSETSSLIVFGSLARNEWTSGSDVDWSLLIDGPADPDHFLLAKEIERRFADKDGLNLKGPGKTATFGTLTSSHELIHHIGGEDDTNRNMTRRLLLLLESCSLSGDSVRERVIRAILNRYIVCGPGIPDQNNPSLRVPRFLLNDVVRLWRTFAVDYAAKKWERSDEGWAIRNAKLRIPRKLTFVKGLLLCLDCELLLPSFPWQATNSSTDLLAADTVYPRLVSGCFDLSQLTPLDMLARVMFLLNAHPPAAKVFKAYDDYIGLVDDSGKREYLEKSVSFEDANTDDIFLEVRQISKQFAQALEHFFFDFDCPLRGLTRKYGLF